MRARPLFRGHYQPHIPADLGFYDLRLAEAREAQAALARAHGIHGFCHFHYWFEGRRLLRAPVDAMLAEGRPDFPFCLCWANEAWTGIWVGRKEQVLIEQRYSRQDDLAHIEALIPYLSDPRYIRVNQKPLLLIYDGWALPDPSATAASWRERVERAGLPGLYLCSATRGRPTEGTSPPEGFDALVEFAPGDMASLPRRVSLLRRLLSAFGSVAGTHPCSTRSGRTRR